MKRLTTDAPEDNFETAMNYVCGGGWATIRAVGEEENVLLTDWAKAQCIAHGCDEFPGTTAEEIDDIICDCVMDDGTCPIALAYAFAIQAVHLRDRLKAIEDILGDNYDLARIYELVQANKEDRLVVSPCKVGDTVWANIAIVGDRYKSSDSPYPVEVVFIGLGKKKGFFNGQYSNGRVFPFDFDQVGKTVFLTREGAAAALEAIKKTEDVTPPSEPQI